MTVNSNGLQNTGSSKPDNPTEDILRNMAFEKVRKKIENLQSSVAHQFEKQLNHITKDVLEEVRHICMSKSDLKDLFTPVQDTNSKRKTNNNGKLSEKQFIARNSVLTDLFEVLHISTLYHIFIVILIILFLNTVVHDFVAHGSINVGISLILTGFGKFHIALFIWLLMQICTIILYTAFSHWAHRRLELKPRSYQIKCWDYFSFLIVLVYKIIFITMPVWALIKTDLPPASSLVVLMEQVRFLMKIHAFLRSNVPKVLSYKPHSDDAQKTMIPSLQTYIYFLFVPTLVYRDTYPRTDHIRWKIVGWHCMEVIGVIFYVSFILERFVIPFFRDFGDQSIEPRYLVLSVFGCMMPGTLVFLCGFYCLLHAWMNASAELLRFADRMFYKDWWNSTSYGVYYRTWNIVVHDWLYTYIYKEMYENVIPKNKIFATLTVFSVSAIVHEYILAFAFRFFYPVLMIMFGGIGVLLMFIKNEKNKSAGNLLMWLSLCVGNGLLLSFYSMEYFARKNCPFEDDSFVQYFIPRSWTCHGLAFDPNWKVTIPGFQGTD